MKFPSKLITLIGVTGIFLNSWGCRTLQFDLSHPNIPEVTYCYSKALNIKKVEEPNGEDEWKDPWKTEKEGGDCEDIAGSLQNCLYNPELNLTKRRIFSKIVCGYLNKTMKKEDEEKIKNMKKIIRKGHAWVEYKKNGRTYILDASLEKPVHEKKYDEYIPFEGGCDKKKIYDYYLKSQNPILFFYNSIK